MKRDIELNLTRCEDGTGVALCIVAPGVADTRSATSPCASPLYSSVDAIKRTIVEIEGV